MLLRSRRALLALLVPVLLVGACSDDDDVATSDDAGSSTSAAPREEDPPSDRTITVFAAASLTDAFAEIAGAFKTERPEITVAFSFAGSSALREQILEGAPADVFASANPSNMTAVVDAGAAAAPQTFARNSLEIAVPKGNPGDIDGLDDFDEADLLLGLCAPEVPCGQFGREALGKAGVTPSIDTEEPDVRALLFKVESGDLDGGIVYRTDVRSAGDDVEGIEIPTAQNVVAEYPIATLARTSNGEAASAFVAFVLSEKGQQILASYGFETG